MIYAGIDYSLSSPAITYYNTDYPLTIENIECRVITDKKVNMPSWITRIDQPKWTQEIHRYESLAKLLIHQPADLFFLENYSYGSVGKVFNIAENMAILKYYIIKYWQSRYVVLAPTLIKKHATGKGNANKVKMAEAFIELLSAEIDSAQIGKSPWADVIDSFYVLSAGLESLSEPLSGE